MSELTGQKYELAYHVTANIEEADIQKVKSELENTITSDGGSVSYSKDPEKMRLSYPIAKQEYSYFGYIHFESDKPETLDHLKENMRVNGNVLRHLLVKIDSDYSKDTDTLRKLVMGERRRTPVRAGVGPKVEKKELPPIKEEEIDKKIEDIIEKM